MVYFKVYADFVQIKYANLNKASMSIEQSFYVFGFLLKHSRITWLYMTTKHSVMKWKGWVCNTHALSLSSFIRDIYILKIYMMILTSPNLCSLKKIHRFTGKGIPIINLRRSSKSLQWRHNASQITSLTIVYSTVYSDADQRKHESSASLPFVWGVHRGPVNSQHKWPVTRKMFPFDDVIMWMEALVLE